MFGAEDMQGGGNPLFAAGEGGLDGGVAPVKTREVRSSPPPHPTLPHPTGCCLLLSGCGGGWSRSYVPWLPASRPACPPASWPGACTPRHGRGALALVHCRVRLLAPCPLLCSLALLKTPCLAATTPPGRPTPCLERRAVSRELEQRLQESKPLGCTPCLLTCRILLFVHNSIWTESPAARPP